MTPHLSLATESSSAKSKHADRSLSGNQEREHFLESFSSLVAVSEDAVNFQKWAVAYLSESAPLVLRAGSLQLSWAAAESGVPRQKFYPGRGPVDLQELISALGIYAKSAPTLQTGFARKSDDSVSGLRAALASQHRKSRALRAELCRINVLHDLVHSGRPLVY